MYEGEIIVGAVENGEFYHVQVGNRREKIAKSSGALWKLMNGGAESGDENEEVLFRSRCVRNLREIYGYSPNISCLVRNSFNLCY